MESLVIFRIPQKPYLVLVTEVFVQRVISNGLKGFNFDLLWPLAPGVSWKELAKARKLAHSHEGLPPGKTLKGNSVAIVLELEGEVSVPLDLAKRSIGKMENELDLQLVDLKSEAPAIGNFEYTDYEVGGVCRILLSCPDAQSLIDKLRPWLKALSWPNGVNVLIRDCYFADSCANEAPVKI